MTLRTSPGTVQGTVRAAPSKSYTHRAFLLGLLAEGTTRVEDALLSEDPLATLQAVEALGAHVTRGDAIAIASDGVVRSPSATLDCMNSGTTMRLLSAIVALAGGDVTLDGDASLRKRPMGPLLAALDQLGARTSSRGGKAPVTIRGPIRGGRATLPGDVSSQFVSALLLAGTRAAEGIEVTLEGELKSEPYVEITREMIADFGGRVDSTPEGYHVAGGQRLRARTYRVPGDYSTAAFPLAAGALAGDVTVANLPSRTAQGDAAIVGLLRRFGADVHEGPHGVRVRKAPLRAIEADLSDTPDLFPILCVLAAHAQGESVLSGAAHLRFKESDRIRTMVTNLQRMGVDARERDDGALIRGGPVKAASGLVTQGDHRVLMSLAVCGLVAQGPLALDDHAAHAVSYPAFLDDFQALGARFEVAP